MALYKGAREERAPNAAPGIPMVWSDWDPVFTNLVVGNGTRTARFCLVGKMVFYRLVLVFGSSTTISGPVSLIVPTELATYGGAGAAPIGDGSCYDVSVGNVVAAVHQTNGRINSLTVAGSNVICGAINATSPFTWATGDELSVTGVYEMA